VIDRLTTMPKVVIARVNGHCYTGALELALACDLVVAAEEARFGDTHAKWGLRPTWGMSQRLIRLVGVARARELSYTARTFTGTEAAAWGLAVRSVPLAELDAAVAELTAAIVTNSAAAIAAYKDLYAHALDQGLHAGLAYEAQTRYPIADTEERVASFR
jgi:enoyl-CoA hydratase/carnithine racemase